MEALPSPIVVITPNAGTKKNEINATTELTMALHHAEELDNDLRRRANEHLALAATLGIDNVVLQDIIELRR